MFQRSSNRPNRPNQPNQPDQPDQPYQPIQPIQPYQPDQPDQEGSLVTKALNDGRFMSVLKYHVIPFDFFQGGAPTTMSIGCTTLKDHAAVAILNKRFVVVVNISCVEESENVTVAHAKQVLINLQTVAYRYFMGDDPDLHCLFVYQRDPKDIIMADGKIKEIPAHPAVYDAIRARLLGEMELTDSEITEITFLVPPPTASPDASPNLPGEFLLRLEEHSKIYAYLNGRPVYPSARIR